MPGPTGAAKLEKLAKSVRTGGKGSVRRKKKVVNNAGGSVSAKLTAVLKKQSLQQIQGVEEANFFHKDGSVLHFNKPKASANFPANTYVIQGNGVKKSLGELMPGILKQLGLENMSKLKEFAMAAGAGGAGPAGDDDDVPALVENFEKASE
eukprot:c32919_g1_i1.p1 GENE.c32919_g1_i1~~c32919_g1_i1.p1  ORF type:complete len:163 (+),score=47.12 c32919_g1_i1:38-490(+)